MKLTTTTFSSNEKHEFDQLLYINGKTKEVMFQTSLSDEFATYNFFKDISKFVKSAMVRKTLFNDYRGEYYQFAIICENEIFPIKWFDLIINERVIISHDIAFETTLIKKNDIVIPFGKFPMWYKENVKFSKYREFKLKSRAYKYMANQVKKN